MLFKIPCIETCFYQLVISNPKGQVHLTALQKAESRGKTPAKLAITIKPLVIEKEDAQFKTEWNSAIEKAEKSLIQTLQSHLTRVVDKTTQKIKMTAKETIRKIKQFHDGTTAKSLMEETITEPTKNNVKETRTEKREG